MENAYPILIQLYENMQECECGLIIKCKSGVHYSNQTGGMHCHHPVVEGSLIKFHIEDCYMAELESITLNFSSMDYETKQQRDHGLRLKYDHIDWMLGQILGVALTGYRVKLNRCQPQEESWLHLTFEKVPQVIARMAEFEDINVKKFSAVLTYLNSD